MNHDSLLFLNFQKKEILTEAIQPINEAIHNSHGNLPITIYTDALRAYREGISTTLGLKVDDISKYWITKPHANNNMAYKLNGTLRKRAKVQRCIFT